MYAIYNDDKCIHFDEISDALISLADYTKL